MKQPEAIVNQPKTTDSYRTDLLLVCGGTTKKK